MTATKTRSRKTERIQQDQTNAAKRRAAAKGGKVSELIKKLEPQHVDLSEAIEKPAPVDAKLLKKEAALRIKYPKAGVVEGSIRQGREAAFGSKVVVTCACECGNTIARATSDLWTFKGCPACLRAAKEAKKAGTKGKK